MKGTCNKNNGLYDIPISAPKEQTDNYFLQKKIVQTPKLHGFIQKKSTPKNINEKPKKMKKLHYTKSTHHDINVMKLKKVSNILNPYIKNPEKEFQAAQILSSKINVIIQKEKTKSGLAGFLNGAMGLVFSSTWLKAIKNNQFATWPGLTENLVKNYLILTIATAEGHLAQENGNLQST